MSQAFVRESEEQWLHDAGPSLSALMIYLTRENNGVRVYEKSSQFSKKYDREVYLMSNGLTYTKDDQGKWYVAE
ncbi:MAG TPA: hypothetical protein VJU78_15655 [Chitinophagaceae bacterium]|nr:hypothetical protein [Chitinophagaceae bacterium]